MKNIVILFMFALFAGTLITAQHSGNLVSTNKITFLHPPGAIESQFVTSEDVPVVMCNQFVFTEVSIKPTFYVEVAYPLKTEFNEANCKSINKLNSNYSFKNQVVNKESNKSESKQLESRQSRYGYSKELA